MKRSSDGGQDQGFDETRVEGLVGVRILDCRTHSYVIGLFVYSSFIDLFICLPVFHLYPLAPPSFQPLYAVHLCSLNTRGYDITGVPLRLQERAYKTITVGDGHSSSS